MVGEVIDISSLIEGDNVNRMKEVDDKIRQACKETGIFSITGHGVDISAMEEILNMAKKLFDLPHEKKMKISVKNSPAFRGYVEQGTEYTANKIDVKEGFYLGHESSSNHVDGLSMDRKNQYPDEDDVPGFREIMATFMDHMIKTGDALMSSIARGLRLPEDLFSLEIFNPPFFTMALWHYPPHPGCTDDGPWGVGPHTDYGVLALLLQDEVGGLQFQTKNGEWIDINPIPGTLVAFTGDTVEAWTHGAYRAALHRVKNSPRKHRYSVPFFYQPSDQCVIRPLDIPDDIIEGVTGGPPKLIKEFPFKYGEYEQAKIIKSHGDYNDNAKNK